MRKSTPWISSLLCACLHACSGSEDSSVNAKGGAGSSAGGSAMAGTSVGGNASDATATGGAAGDASEAGSGGASGASGGTPDAAGSSGAGGLDAGSTEVQCSARPQVFPTFERACSSAAACFVAHHQIDCCGTQVALGISLSEKSRFEAAEATCRLQHARCACTPAPTRTDTGQIAPNPQQISVDCRAQICTTFVP